MVFTDGFPLLADQIFGTCGQQEHRQKSYLSVESSRGLFGNWEVDPSITEVYAVPDVIANNGLAVPPDHTNILLYKPFADLILHRVQTFLRGEDWNDSMPLTGGQDSQDSVTLSNTGLPKHSVQKSSRLASQEHLSVSGPTRHSSSIASDAWADVSRSLHSLGLLPALTDLI